MWNQATRDTNESPDFELLHAISHHVSSENVCRQLRAKEAANVLYAFAKLKMTDAAVFPAITTSQMVCGILGMAEMRQQHCCLSPNNVTKQRNLKPTLFWNQFATSPNLFFLAQLCPDNQIYNRLGSFCNWSPNVVTSHPAIHATRQCLVIQNGLSTLFADQ